MDSAKALAQMDVAVKNANIHTLATPAQLKELDLTASQKFKIAESMTACGLRVANILHEVFDHAQQACEQGIASAAQDNHAPHLTILDIVVADKDVGKIYAETALWEHVSKVTQTLIETGKQTAKGTLKKPRAPIATEAQSEDSVGKVQVGVKRTFREFYVEQITSAFGDNIQELRSDKSFKGRQRDITFLVDCIESGACNFEDWETDLQLNSFDRMDQTI